MLELSKMKVCLLALVILVSNHATAETHQQRTNQREAKQLNLLSDPEQKYDLELSFPIDSDEAENTEGRRARIEQLLQEILNDQELVSLVWFSEISGFTPKNLNIIWRWRHERRYFPAWCHETGIPDNLSQIWSAGTMCSAPAPPTPLSKKNE